MISGTGANGRVTKKDLQNYINSNTSSISEPVKRSTSKPESIVVNQDGEKIKMKLRQKKKQLLAVQWKLKKLMRNRKKKK